MASEYAAKRKKRIRQEAAEVQALLRDKYKDHATIKNIYVERNGVAYVIGGEGLYPPTAEFKSAAEAAIAGATEVVVDADADMSIGYVYESPDITLTGRQLGDMQEQLNKIFKLESVKVSILPENKNIVVVEGLDLSAVENGNIETGKLSVVNNKGEMQKDAEDRAAVNAEKYVDEVVRRRGGIAWSNEKLEIRFV